MNLIWFFAIHEGHKFVRCSEDDLRAFKRAPLIVGAMTDAGKRVIYDSYLARRGLNPIHQDRVAA